MNSRPSQALVITATSRRPFFLQGLSGDLSAASCSVDTEEALVKGAPDLPAASVLVLPDDIDTSEISRASTVEHQDLQRDRLTRDSLLVRTAQERGAS